ncbi:MAG: type II toxin-antitoxin system VapC family toxin [Vicinamibacterales bacterium]
MLLLDTHVWIWTVEGDTRRVGRRSRQLIAKAEARESVRISPATIFEVVALHAAGRLQLSRSPEQWIREALDLPGMHVAELSAAVAIDAGHIPRTALADPLDRLLVATARQLDATFLTSDSAILAYAAQRGIARVRNAAV